MNLLEETLEIIERYDKTPDDIDYINMPAMESSDESYELSNITYFNDDKEDAWKIFSEFAEEHFSDYDNGYGGQEVPRICIIFKDSNWLSRGEYDGSEWWVYNQTPEIII